jgi:hypothetical protein
MSSVDIRERFATAKHHIQRRNMRGATMLQYVILVGCIAVPALAAYAAVGPKLAENYVKTALSVMGLEDDGGN